jgi:hypothetical protein
MARSWAAPFTRPISVLRKGLNGTRGTPGHHNEARAIRALAVPAAVYAAYGALVASCAKPIDIINVPPFSPALCRLTSTATPRRPSHDLGVGTSSLVSPSCDRNY